MMCINIKTLLNQAVQKLTDISNTPRLDVDLLLAHSLNKPRSYLYTHPEQNLLSEQIETFTRLLERRQANEPIAYILGHKEFWSLDLHINKNVLIPRSETELLVELILKNFPTDSLINLADLGTGSGAIALALAHERPNWQIFATDICAKALAVAKNNAQRFAVKNVRFVQGNWCQALSVCNFDVIVSNPPYIPKYDPHLLTDIRYEPALALAAGKDGLKNIRIIIKQAKDKLRSGGLLILEHGFDQGKIVQELLQEYQYEHITSHKDLSGYERITMAAKKLSCESF